MMFDSHVRQLLEASAVLVNGITDGYRYGKSFSAPDREQMPDVIRAALSLAPTTTLDDADIVDLIATAHQLRHIYEATTAGAVDEAASIVNTALRTTGARPQLDRVLGEPWQLHFHGSNDTLATGWSAGCIAAVALAIGSDLAGRLGVCAAERCDRVFIDTSRNAGRQFCSTTCQNRTKTATYRARQVANPGTDLPTATNVRLGMSRSWLR